MKTVILICYNNFIAVVSETVYQHFPYAKYHKSIKISSTKKWYTHHLMKSQTFSNNTTTDLATQLIITVIISWVARSEQTFKKNYITATVVSASSWEILNTLLPLIRGKLQVQHKWSTLDEKITKAEMLYLYIPWTIFPHIIASLWVPEKGFSHHWTLNRAFLVSPGSEWTFD